MKKIIIVIAIIAALVGGGLFAKQKIESDVVAEVKTLIVSAPEYAEVSASDVKFDLLSKELVLSGIEVFGTEKLANVVYLIDKIVLKGFNTDSLSATSGDLPLVAEEIYLENLSTTVPPGLSLSYESYSIKGYKQNLALLQEALQQDLSQEEPWKRILNFKLASSEIKNYRLEDKLAGTGNLLIESSSITPAGENAYDFSIKNTSIDVPAENMAISLGEFKMEALAMPTPKIMAELFKLLKESEANPSAIPNLTVDDFKMYFKQNISFSDMIINFDQAELFSMKGLDISSQANPIQVGYEVEDAKISKTGATLLEIPDLSLLLLDELIVNSSVKFALNEARDIIDYSHETSVKDLFAVTYEASLKTPVTIEGLIKNYFVLFGSTLNSMDVKYEDKGFLPRFANLAQIQENQSVEDLSTELQLLINMNVQETPELAPIAEAFLKIWEKPGSIELKVLKPTAITDLISSLPNNLEVKYTQNAKTLKELVDELQAK